MRLLWRLAAGSSIAMAVVAAPSSGAVAYYFGGMEAWAFLYGVAVGFVTFVSIAAVVSLILRRPSESRMMLGFTIYLGRLMFAAVALAIPLFLGLLPVLSVVCGLVTAYVVENVALLWGAWKYGGARSDNRYDVRSSGIQRSRMEG